MKYKYADISRCGLYRFSLVRDAEDVRPGRVLFCLNNPSVADALIDDPTVRRGWGFTLAFGYQHMVFVNTNPYRATDPKLAQMPPESILAENDHFILEWAQAATIRIAAWGDRARPELAKRAEAQLRLAGPLHVLDLTKSGVPRHPLYLRGDLVPAPWPPCPSL